MPQMEFTEEECQRLHRLLEEDAKKHPSVTAKRKAAQAIIKEEAYWAFGLGLVPIPVVDAALLTAVEVRMIRRIGDVYGRAFSESYARNLAASLLTGVGAAALGTGVVAGLFRMVSPLAFIGGLLSVSLTALPLHYAIGSWLADSLETDPHGDPLIDRFKDYWRAARSQPSSTAPVVPASTSSAAQPTTPPAAELPAA